MMMDDDDMCLFFACEACSGSLVPFAVSRLTGVDKAFFDSLFFRLDFSLPQPQARFRTLFLAETKVVHTLHNIDFHFSCHLKVADLDTIQDQDLHRGMQYKELTEGRIKN